MFQYIELDRRETFSHVGYHTFGKFTVGSTFSGYSSLFSRLTNSRWYDLNGKKSSHSLLVDFVGGVHIVGGERGDAFIAFHSDDDARQAMQKDGGLICQQPVKLFLSSKMEMHNVIQAARSKPAPTPNPVPNPMQQTQQANIPQVKRSDPLSQQFTHDIDENQHQAVQQTSASTSQSGVTNDPVSSFLDVVSKMQQQQQKANTATTSLPSNAPVLPTPSTATPAATGLAPANLVLQLLQSNLSNLPPNLLAQVQGQFTGQSKFYSLFVSLVH